MGLGMFVLGGALAGAGAGLAKQQEIVDTERRDRILEQLKTSRMQEEYRLRDTENANQVMRNANVAIEDREDKQAFNLGVAGAQAQAAAEAKRQDREFEIRMQSLKGDQEIQKILTEINARAEAEKDKIDKSFTDSSGVVFGITNSGRIRNLTEEEGVLARPVPKASSSDSLFGQGATPGGPRANTEPVTEWKRGPNGSLIMVK